jgi:ATP synthase I chain
MLPDSADKASATTAEFTERDLQDALLRSVKWLGLLALVAIPITWALGGWQSAALLVVGAAVAALSLWEWRSLVTAISAQFEADPNATPRPMARVLIRFFLRFALVAGLLYVSLKCLHGSAYALLAGLGLAMLTASFQALKLLRQWR